MAPIITHQTLSHDPAGRILARFEAVFEARIQQSDIEIYPALHEAWEEAHQFHRTIELHPFEVPHGARVRDTICRLFSLLPDRKEACRQASRIAAAFSYPEYARTPAGTRAFSHLALLCHSVAREPGQCDLRFSEANPRTHATEQLRGQGSFGHTELTRLLKFLSAWPPAVPQRLAA